MDQDTPNNDLIELLQFHALKYKPTTLEVRDQDGRAAQIGVDSGDVVYVRTRGGISGTDALVEILSWVDPTIVDVAAGAPDRQRNVDVPMGQLLMEVFDRGQGHQTVEEPSSAEDPPSLSETLSDDDRVRNMLALGVPILKIQGFVSASFIDTSAGRIIETVGSPVSFETWMLDALMAGGSDMKYATVMRDEHLDVIVPRTRFDGLGLLLRVSADETNPGLLNYALRAVFDP